MLFVKIDGVHSALDGEYELDGSAFTNREHRTIKQLSGVRALELADAFAAGDNDLLVAFAAIALTRAGKQFVVDVLWDAPGGAITFEERQEADASPPPLAPSGSNGGEPELSGPPSNGAGEHSPETSNHQPFGVPV